MLFNILLNIYIRITLLYFAWEIIIMKNYYKYFMVILFFYKCFLGVNSNKYLSLYPNDVHI